MGRFWGRIITSRDLESGKSFTVMFNGEQDCDFDRQTEETWESGRKELESNEFTVLGRHPRLIYEIWMNKTIVDKLDKNFRPRAYKPEKVIPDDLYKQLSDLRQAPENTTKTTITNWKIKVARNYPRSSQDKVMGKLSANDVCNAP
jgi:hypothetical protein